MVEKSNPSPMRYSMASLRMSAVFKAAHGAARPHANDRKHIENKGQAKQENEGRKKNSGANESEGKRRR